MIRTRALALILTLTLGLSACGSGEQAANSPTAGAVSGLARALAPGRFETNQDGAFTATRASLRAQGFDQPLLVGTLSAPSLGSDPVKAGLLLRTTTRGTQFWAGADNATVQTRGGVLAGTQGLLWDLHSAETAATQAALRAGGHPGHPGYRRIFRHLDAENTVIRTPMDCVMQAQGPQIITVFDRSHRTQALVERCTGTQRDALGAIPRIENRYWRDPASGVIWRSEQWISPNMGVITLERVFL